MEMQQRVPFALLLSYKIFRTAVNGKKYLSIIECVNVFLPYL
jgi:hypothetical protein